MGDIEILIIKSTSINRFTTGTITIGEIATLSHNKPYQIKMHSVICCRKVSDIFSNRREPVKENKERKMFV